MKTRHVLSALSTLSIFALGCATEQPAAPDLEIRLARGGSSGGGGGGGSTTLIVPVRLDDPKSLGCTGTDGYVVNAGTPSMAGGDCAKSGKLWPYVWTAGAGGTVLPIADGWVKAISSDGTVFGMASLRPFYKTPSGALTYLPYLSSANTGGDVSAAAANGSIVAGYVERAIAGGWTGDPVIWTWSGTEWSVASSPLFVNAINENGQVMAGGTTVLTNVGGNWSQQTLPAGGAIRGNAMGINATGSVIVGTRTLPVTADPSKSYEQHVAWIADGAGGWTLSVLGAIDVGEGRAYSVADQQDGSTIAVGYTWQDKSGPRAQRWAVAWRKPAGAAEFGAPVRLQPLSKGASASAQSVNSKGEIVGTAATATSTVAVMWKL